MAASVTSGGPSAEASGSEALPIQSHSKPHHTKNKKSDPFLELSNEAIKLPDQPSPSNEDENAASQSSSLMMDLILTPLNMISFILSLCLIDIRQRQWRMSEHPSEKDSFWFRLTHPHWLNPQPYQDSRDSTWKHADSRPFQNPTEDAYRGWYVRKKRRALAKMEFSDAFEMRGRVIFALIAWGLVGIFGLTYATRRMYGWATNA